MAERNALQQQLAELAAQKEAEIRQLHGDRAALQVASHSRSLPCKCI